ncbi:hypothetical protein SI65_06474 [Aspergillus terreus]|uniref:Uncharacterized protein n=1 Tax=Aspergillus terreus TaxID=33178 RepID=A0A5M3Z240_ASPTE|nr:hypothetical protein ATETN484_0006010300 [Aspergillus terreus]GFF19844.1 hypothetical protein SI65_06474 [Aspergillus terreus]
MAETTKTAEPDPGPGESGSSGTAAQHYTSPSKAAYERRREQVRRAQKKHREKNKKYCRSLEDELHRLYDSQANADELRVLRYENEILRDILARHSIPVPVGISPPKPSLAEVTFTSNGGHHQLLQVKMPENEHGSDHPTAPPSCANPDEHTPSDMHSQFGQSSSSRTEFSEARNGPNIVQMGVDFVLSLERPCLFHTRSPDAEEPSGHALSMQGMLLSRAPQDLHDHAAWAVPAQQLDKLFELSGCLGLDGYITPVQAWNRITSRFEIAQLPLNKLEMLRCAMVPYIKCYGFGAIMEEDIFENLLEEVFK